MHQTDQILEITPYVRIDFPVTIKYKYHGKSPLWEKGPSSKFETILKEMLDIIEKLDVRDNKTVVFLCRYYYKRQ